MAIEDDIRSLEIIAASASASAKKLKRAQAGKVVTEDGDLVAITLEERQKYVTEAAVSIQIVKSEAQKALAVEAEPLPVPVEDARL